MIVMVPFAFVCQGLQVQTRKPEAGRRRKKTPLPNRAMPEAGRRGPGLRRRLAWRGCRVFLSAEGRLAQERRSEPALEGAVASTAEIADIRASRNWSLQFASKSLFLLQPFQGVFESYSWIGDGRGDISCGGRLAGMISAALRNILITLALANKRRKGTWRSPGRRSRFGRGLDQTV